MAVNALAQLAQMGGGAPRAELPPASGMDPNKGYGAYLSSIPNLTKVEDPAQGADGVLETYTDGQNIYRVMRQTGGGGASLTNEYGDTTNNKFPVSIHKSSLSDYYLHEETGTLRPKIGSSQLIVHPDTGAVLEANKYDGRSTGKTFKTFVISAAAALSAGFAAAAMMGGTAVGGVGGVAGAGTGGTMGGAVGGTAAGTAGTSVMGAGSAGLGGASGTGLTMGGGGLGLTAGTGSGLSLAGATGGGLGMTAGSAGAGSIGAGIGASGFAAGSGSLLGAAALQGGAAGGGALGGAAGAAGAAGASGAAASGFQWKDLIGPAVSLGGAVMGANAADKAADAQIQAAREAAALQEPWRQAGMQGLNRLTDLLGVSGRSGADGYGSLMRDFSMADYQADPGLEFRRQQGEQGLTRAAAASGLRGSGKYLKDAMSFNSGLASQEYGNAFNRFQTNRAAKLNPLQSLAGVGQSAAGTIGEFGTQAGNAAAAGKVGQANAFTNALTQGYSMYQNQQQQNQNNALMQQFLSRG